MAVTAYQQTQYNTPKDLQLQHRYENRNSQIVNI